MQKKERTSWTDYFNQWVDDPKAMAKSEGWKMGAGGVALSLVPVTLSFMTFGLVSLPVWLFAAAGVAAGTQPGRESLPGLYREAKLLLSDGSGNKNRLPYQPRYGRKDDPSP